MNSRAKGKRGELNLVHKLNAYGYETYRNQQFAGSNGDADLTGLPYIHIECKNVERLNLSAAMEQSRRDAFKESQKQGTAMFPAVFHKRNREGWLVTMDLDSWQMLYDAFLEKRTEKGVSR